VTTLTLPVLLVDRGVEAMMTEAVMLKRAQSILFAVKATLQQNCAMDNPLKTIRLVSPGHSSLCSKSTPRFSRKRTNCELLTVIGCSGAHVSYDQQTQMPKSPKSAIKKMFKKRHRTIDNRAALMVSGREA
jgi:hypothetical protein